MVVSILPMILLKNNILFPYSEIRVEFIKTEEKIVLENSLKCHDGQLLLVNLEDPLEENPNIKLELKRLCIQLLILQQVFFLQIYILDIVV